ncbi:hypothetical protein Lal_00045100 [Lupinus albus]|nr:hypothetical protein Lal_00045100 [Lupinus albus]
MQVKQKKLTRGTGHAHGPLSPSPRTARDTCAMAWVQSWPLFQLALGKCVTASISPSTRTHVSCPQCHRARVMSSLPPSTFVIPALSPSTRDHARGTTPHAQSTQPPHSMTHTQGTMLARHGAWPEAMPHTTL